LTYCLFTNSSEPLPASLSGARSEPHPNLAPAGGEAKQTEIATTQIPSYRNSQQYRMENQLCYTLGKLIFLFKSGGMFLSV